MSIKPRKQRKIHVTKSKQRRRTVWYFPNKTKRVIPWITHTIVDPTPVFEKRILETWTTVMKEQIAKGIVDNAHMTLNFTNSGYVVLPKI